MLNKNTKNRVGIIKRIMIFIACIVVTACIWVIARIAYIGVTGCGKSTLDKNLVSSDDIDVGQAINIISDDCLDLVLLCSDSSRFTFYVDRNTRVVWVRYMYDSLCPVPNADGSFKTFKGELPEAGNAFSEEELIQYAKEIYNNKYNRMEIKS